MSFANNITQKCQAAAQAMLVARVTALTLTSIEAASVFSGIEPGEVTAKRVVTECKRAQYEDYPDGNWSADLIIRVICPHADISEADFHTLCGDAYLGFFQAPADVCTALSNADLEFTAQAVYPRAQEWDLVDDDSGSYWVSELLLTVKCCGSVVA